MAPYWRLTSTASGYPAAMGGSPRRPPDLSIKISDAAAELRGVRRALSPLLAAMDDPGLADSVQLAVSELLANVARHATGVCTLSCWGGDPFRVHVDDDSPALPMRREADGSAGGHGLAILDALADEWGFERTATGKVVWATFRRPADP